MCVFNDKTTRINMQVKHRKAKMQTPQQLTKYIKRDFRLTLPISKHHLHSIDYRDICSCQRYSVLPALRSVNRTSLVLPRFGHTVGSLSQSKMHSSFLKEWFPHRAYDYMENLKEKVCFEIYAPNV